MLKQNSSNKLIALLNLFTSFGTLICCALPALFVTLGLGATLAGLITVFPQMIWFSEHKEIVFGVAGGLLLLGGVFQKFARSRACPVDPKMSEACEETKDWSFWIYWISVALYAIGVLFAFVLPRFLS